MKNVQYWKAVTVDYDQNQMKANLQAEKAVCDNDRVIFTHTLKKLLYR